MHTRSLTLGLTLLMLTGFIGSAAAKTQHLNWRCTGSTTFTNGVETHIDTNGDNVSADLDQGIVNCTIGRFFAQEEIEFTGPFAPTTCPQGTAEYHLVQSHIVLTEEKTGDQLFGEGSSVTLCSNPTAPDFSFSFTGKSIFTGGTGKFAGATGSTEPRGAGKFLAFGVKGGVFGGLGQFTYTETGTLTLPKGEDD